ncbi:MAG: ribokinase [Armatimonadetes bacterium]|nr:ribokinase [Armatimonadota bacterium]
MAVKAIVLGSANMDLVVQSPRMPVAGETVLGGRFQKVRGGKGANQAVACARLGAETWMLARVGTDAFGDELVAGLRSDGVNVDLIVRDPDEPSGVAFIVVDASGQNSIVVAPGANMRLSPEDLERVVSWAAFDVLLMQLEVPTSTVLEASRKASEAGVLTVLDAGPPQPVPKELLGAVDVLSPNETEARAILGLPADAPLVPDEAAQRLLELGAKAVVLKLGADGALLATADGLWRVPAFRVEPVDTTGAGDAFTAALAISLAEGRPLQDAARFACAAGALACTVFGAAPSMPSREAVERMLAAGC